MKLDFQVIVIFVLLLAVLATVLSVLAIWLLRELRTVTRETLWRNTLTFFGVMGVVVIVLLILAATLFTGGVGFLWLAVCVVVVVEAVRKRRASQQYALLWLLTVAAERLMPLAPAVAALARERGGLFGQRCHRLADLLNAGIPLPDALERVGGLLPPHALPMIRVGADTGALAPALRQAAVAYNAFEPIWLALVGKIAYLLIVLAWGTCVLTFVMIKIVPSFRKIFEDFQTELPGMTTALISLSNAFVEFWYLFPGPLLLLLPLLLVYAMVRYWGWIQWDLPGLAGLARRLDSAHVLDGLALAARQQRPLGEGVAALAKSYPKPDIRRRLMQTEADILTGSDCCESLHRRGLIQAAELAVLQAAQRVSNLGWAMQEMADSARRRLAYRVQGIVQAVFPLLVLLIGLSVMFVMVSLFLPLIALITRLAR